MKKISRRSSASSQQLYSRASLLPQMNRSFFEVFFRKLVGRANPLDVELHMPKQPP